MTFMKQIPLTQGQIALVDDEDFVRLNKYKWFAQKVPYGYYAARNQSFPGLCGDYRKRRYLSSPMIIRVQMSRQILGLATDDPREPDHKNHNTLNNCKKNLRIATKQQNHWNKNFPRGKTGLIGVRKEKNGRYIACIQSNHKKLLYLGTFDTAEEAATARDEKALELRGEFAVLNKVS